MFIKPTIKAERCQPRENMGRVVFQVRLEIEVGHWVQLYRVALE